MTHVFQPFNLDDIDINPFTKIDQNAPPDRRSAVTRRKREEQPGRRTRRQRARHDTAGGR